MNESSFDEDNTLAQEGEKVSPIPAKKSDMRSIGGANGLRSDMTHIAVTTAENQLVTIDMPESETKRVTVR